MIGGQFMKRHFAALGTVVLLLGGATAQAGAAVDYPTGYRAWHHVKSMVIQPGHALENPFGGIHHVYANKQALEGLNTGKYPNGAVLVFDLLDYQEGGNALQEGQRKLVGVMVRDAAKYAATGGWGYEGFAGDSTTERLTKDGGQSCHSCHVQTKEAGYVFSKLRK